jgi:O-antigen/teichoic acid export membrane protein
MSSENRTAPGGTGAVLGMRMIRLSGVQGTAFAINSLLQMGMLVLVAQFLGPSELGRYSLLLFLAALIMHVLHIAAKPGTISRTFGGGDEDDDDEEDGEEASSSPKHSLGVGLVMSVALGAAGAVVIALLREPIADMLLGGAGDENLVVLAGILGGVGVVFRLASIALWFERRPSAYLVAEVARPAISIAVLTPLVATGLGVEGALIGATAGTAAAAGLAVLMLRGSFEPSIDLAEAGAIARRGAMRAPILLSLFTIQQADVFLLSRFVDHADVGIYTLASRLGVAVTFAPQGFRVAMRPLTKSVLMPATQEEYGKSIFRGQLLGYFLLLCISGVLLMVLTADLLIGLAPPDYADAAPLIPLSAAALMMPALYRTVNTTATWPGKTRAVFIVGTVGGALAFIGLTLLIGPELGIYAPPVALLASLGTAVVITFVRGQLSEKAIEFPYGEVATALGVATVIGLGYEALTPLGTWADLALAGLGMALYVGLLFALRVIPEHHLPALAQMARTSVHGRPDLFNPTRGLRSLEPGQREALHAAVMTRIPEAELLPEEDGRPDEAVAARGTSQGEDLVRALRSAGVRGGLQVSGRSEHDAEIARFLFADEPIAVRQATMRRLLAAGEQPGDLRALEDLVARLAKLPSRVWSEAGPERSN